MKNAIEKAVKAGYKNLEKNLFLAEWEDDEGGGKVSHHFLLDLLFWKALGEALNWGGRGVQLSTWYLGGKSQEKTEKAEYREYEYHWHRFIDHLASGGDVDSFFNELLTPSNSISV